jgi:uncharacterized glyoxalase superfamily protein PhnB
MLRGDGEAIRRLHAAGARPPKTPAPGGRETTSALAASIGKLSPMLGVADMDATVAWYRSIGFELAGSHAEEGRMDWASVTLGDAEIMFVPSADAWRESTSGLSLWIRTSRLDELYSSLKSRQLERANAALSGQVTDAPELRFTQDLHTAFYGQREFCISDPNGVELYFYQPVE